MRRPTKGKVSGTHIILRSPFIRGESISLVSVAQSLHIRLLYRRGMLLELWKSYIIRYHQNSCLDPIPRPEEAGGCVNDPCVIHFFPRLVHTICTVDDLDGAGSGVLGRICLLCCTDVEAQCVRRHAMVCMYLGFCHHHSKSMKRSMDTDFTESRS